MNAPDEIVHRAEAHAAVEVEQSAAAMCSIDCSPASGGVAAPVGGVAAAAGNA